MGMNLFVSEDTGYALLDCGDERKLERFGPWILDRPSPQAIWPKRTPQRWSEAHAFFERQESGNGEWRVHQPKCHTPWRAQFFGLQFEIRLTGFGNVGLFPEHRAHWDWLRDNIRTRAQTADAPHILNLFAYTGGASLVCALAGARVTHVDAAKAVNAWAIANAKHNHSPAERLRFLAEDAPKFINREIRRGRRYDGIILDPPSFGRGTAGEVWKIERDFYPLLCLCQELLSEHPLFLLITAHSPGITPMSLQSLMPMTDGTWQRGEMLLQSPHAALPAGVYLRWTP